jgi:hypothetical protein
MGGRDARGLPGLTWVLAEVGGDKMVDGSTARCVRPLGLLGPSTPAGAAAANCRELAAPHL